MSEPNVVPRGAGELIADTPDRRVEIPAEHDAMHATCGRFAPRREDADLHVHRRHTESVYVLEGGMAVRLGGRRLRMEAGSWLSIPAGVRAPQRGRGEAGCGIARADQRQSAASIA